MSIKYPLQTPMCPHCERLQHDYESSVNLNESSYGQVVPHFCEHTFTCGKIFFIKKVEAEPLYKSYTKQERESDGI